MRTWILALVSTALFVAACSSESARDRLAAARQALAGGDYAAASEAADAGLEAGADEVTAWGLQLLKLEALARGGRSDATLAQLESLAGQRPEQMPADQYAATADQLRAAGAGAAAAQALDLGLKRFPDDAELTTQIEKAKQSAGANSEELEMLCTLGYIEC